MMDTILFVLTIILQWSLVSSDKYAILPPIYKMEDYKSCMERNDSYCKLNIRLINNGYENDTLWNLINDSINDKYKYNRNVIHRAICVPKNESFSLGSIKNFSKLYINEELKATSLFGLINDVTCTTKDGVKVYWYDKLLLLSLVTYISLIAYATIKDSQKRIAKTENITEKILASLSLTSNWKKVWNTKGDENFNKLKSIQGIRSYNMLLIIKAHTLLSFSFLYISNPEEAEKLFAYSSVEVSSTFTSFLVQPFFLISSWILTFQVYDIYRDHGKFTVRHAFIMLINRFFRIGVCSTIMILVLASSWYRLVEGPLTFDTNDLIQGTCRRNAWQTFCFIQNFLLPGQMCHGSTWYLAVDFQLYIVTLITLYCILRFKLSEWNVISFLTVTSCMLYGSIIYFNDMNIVAKIDVNSLRRHVFIVSKEYYILYTSSYSNWTTSLVGISMGIIYSKNRHLHINNNKVISVLWMLIFFGLPSVATYMAAHVFKGIQAAVLGALVKPMYCLGIGIGILGMSHNIGGPIKSVCENKYAVMMSNFSYSGYIFQLPIIFLKGASSYSLVEFGPTKLLNYFLFFDAPLSILAGIIGTVIFEKPGVNLQKIFLPQIERKRQKLQKDQ